MMDDAAAALLSRGAARGREKTICHKEDVMLHWAIVFFVVALIAAFFGFAGIAASAAGIAKILFVVFLALAAISLLFGRRAPLY